MWIRLFKLLHQFEYYMEGLGFGKAFDPGHDLDIKLTKGDALVNGQQFVDQKVALIRICFPQPFGRTKFGMQEIVKLPSFALNVNN